MKTLYLLFYSKKTKKMYEVIVQILNNGKICHLILYNYDTYN